MSSTPDSVFQQAYEAGASDVHLVVGSPVLFRIDGELLSQSKQAITADAAEQFIEAVLGHKRYAELKEAREIDVSYGIKNGVRLRINCHYERGNLGLAARIVPVEIPNLKDIQVGEVIEEMCDLHDGLILFTGPTGAGKSTSLAAMIQHINEQRATNIITLEDPIEFMFPVGKGVIRQRQLGTDFFSFEEALRRVLRQDPDIIMVGEMRDLETISAALTLAETGHLIFGTLHTPNAVQAVDRIVDVFPPHQQQQVRTQLSLSMRAVVAQRLLPKEGGGRVAQREILVNTPAVAHIIRDSRLQELKSAMQTSADKGMITFEKDAKRLFHEGLISKETYELVK